jgi:cob(I)alamin adenosyltransferase
VRAEHVSDLEQLMDRLSESLKPLENFVLPGGSSAAAQLHVARAVCRRAERALLTLAEHEPIPERAVAYLNRLSDALFVMARHENHARQVADILWNSRA